MAEIFLAQDAEGSICAIKRILPHLAHEESFIRMFIDEARIVSQIQHSNVAQVYDQGKSSGFYYIAMEFVQGHSLLALSDRAKSMKIPLPRGLLAFIITELLAGLASAHAARDAKGRHLGIVHRDVTPQNVLLSYEGEVKLIDFGVAKARARLTQTEAGFTKGKLSYMSPEQARGEDLDARSDLFSVGIVLYEITTGSRLFNKEGPGGILGAIVNDPVPPPSIRVKGYPKDLEVIVMHALEKDANRRYQSADEMRDALLRFARREKPQPSRSRLKDLVHDLFGDPESQKVIEAAKAVSAPTPSRVVAHRDDLVRGASFRVKGSDVPEASEPVDPVVGHRSVVGKEPVEDETRMMRPEYQVAPSRVALRKLELTTEGTPIIDLPVAQEAPVPEPSVPLRVKIAKFIAAFAVDLSVSWRAHRRRYFIGAAAASTLLVLIAAHLAGVSSLVASWMGGAAERAREIRRSAGLDEDLDAGAQPTVLRLLTEPPGASIAINGLGVGGVTPHEIGDLEVGRPLAIELSLIGYRTRSEKLTLWPNTGVQEISVKLERKVGTLVVESEPSGGRVVADGKILDQRTPVRLENVFADEPVKISISKEGRIPRSTVAIARDGEEVRVVLSLPIDEAQIPPGRIGVTTSPSGCAIFIDDQLIGRSPIDEHPVKPGPHAIRASCENHRDETRAVSVSSGQINRQVFSLTPNVFGYLTVNPIPPEGSIVEVNGKRVPLPVEFLKVVPGRHVVVVMNANLRRRTERTVDVRPNKSVAMDVNLLVQ